MVRSFLGGPVNGYIVVGSIAVPILVQSGSRERRRTVLVKKASFEGSVPETSRERRLFRSLTDLAQFDATLKHQTPMYVSRSLRISFLHFCLF